MSSFKIHPLIHRKAGTRLVGNNVVANPMLQAQTRRHRMLERKHAHHNRNDGQITSRPRQAQSFAKLEDAKGNDNDAHTELEGVFRYPGSGRW